MPSAERVREGLPVHPGGDYGNPDPEWLGIDWRRHLRRVQLPGAEVNYVDLGEGEPIVFLHGLAGCWRNWLECLPHFGRSHRAIALDLPGFGESPMPSWPIDVPAYGRLVQDFCEKLGIERVAALVGNSLGGFVATEAVIERPERYERLVLVSAAGVSFVKASESRNRAIVRGFRALAPQLARPHRSWYARPRGKKLAFGQVIRHPERLRPEILYEQIDPGLNSLGFAQAFLSAGGYDTRERLREIEIPTMIVWGLSDRVVPVKAAFAYARRIPHARLELFESTGHVPMIERPRRFNAAVEAFLAD
jgi:pimeloyl-ACP methyl ester carboxylesterase